MDPRDKIIVALDVPRFQTARPLIELLAPHVGAFKVGLELISAGEAKQTIEFIHANNGNVFYDGKLHDIPNTVQSASREVAHLGVAMFNVHCIGGRVIMEAAKKGVAEAVNSASYSFLTLPNLLGVTILTSMDIAALYQIGIYPPNNVEETVVKLAKLAKKSGLDGVIASPREIGLIREACGADFLIVTPGVRSAGIDVNDQNQKRVMTPAEAIREGANQLVVGRQILNPDNGTPVDAAKRIADEIASAV